MPHGVTERCRRDMRQADIPSGTSLGSSSLAYIPGVERDRSAGLRSTERSVEAGSTSRRAFSIAGRSAPLKQRSDNLRFVSPLDCLRICDAGLMQVIRREL